MADQIIDPFYTSLSHSTLLHDYFKQVIGTKKMADRDVKHNLYSHLMSAFAYPYESRKIGKSKSCIWNLMGLLVVLSSCMIPMASAYNGEEKVISYQDSHCVYFCFGFLASHHTTYSIGH